MKNQETCVNNTFWNNHNPPFRKNPDPTRLTWNEKWKIIKSMIVPCIVFPFMGGALLSFLFFRFIAPLLATIPR